MIKILEKVIWLNGKPKNIRCDNGPEFIAVEFQNWCRGNEIKFCSYNRDVRLRTVILSDSTEAIGEQF